MSMKTFVAEGPGGWIAFTFKASNSQEARQIFRSYKKRSDTIEKIRRWRDRDTEGYLPDTRHYGAQVVEPE